MNQMENLDKQNILFRDINSFHLDYRQQKKNCEKLPQIPLANPAYNLHLQYDHTARHSEKPLHESHQRGFDPSIDRTVKHSDTTYDKQDSKKNQYYDWNVARELLIDEAIDAENFFINGTNIYYWSTVLIPTLGASESTKRLQKMFCARVPLSSFSRNAEAKNIFLKFIPYHIWMEQWRLQKKYNGGYVTDSENFVMEAAASIFLRETNSNICPTLLGVLNVSQPPAFFYDQNIGMYQTNYELEKLFYRKNIDFNLNHNIHDDFQANINEENVEPNKIHTQLYNRFQYSHCDENFYDNVRDTEIQYLDIEVPWCDSEKKNYRPTHRLFGDMLVEYRVPENNAHQHTHRDNGNNRSNYLFNRGSKTIFHRRKANYSYVVLVYEFYGKDLIAYLKLMLTMGTAYQRAELKRVIQFMLLKCLQALHRRGICHLDFTLENILIGSDGIKLCDFAKAAPMWSRIHKHRNLHSHYSTNRLVAFQSCEPTIGKTASMPPECWKALHQSSLLGEKIQLDQKPRIVKNEHLTNIANRIQYFRVIEADVFMLCMAICVIWNEGELWGISDILQDNKYAQYRSNIYNIQNISSVSFPLELIKLAEQGLEHNPFKRISIVELEKMPWWTCNLKKFFSSSNNIYCDEHSY